VFKILTKIRIKLLVNRYYIKLLKYVIDITSCKRFGHYYFFRKQVFKMLY